jgi:IS5 family transposase
MMAVRFKKNTTNSFFGHFLYDQLLDKKHFLVQAKSIVDWDRFTQRCLRWYKGAGEVGRPPYNPSCLLKMLFISYLYNFSERQTEMMVNDSIAMKCFLGLGVDEKAPDHSSLTYFKERLLKGAGKSAYDQLLREILTQAKQRGVKFGSIQIIDSVHTIADVNTDKDEDRKGKGGKPRDPSAKWGTKGQKKIKDKKTSKMIIINKSFFGYKTHTSANADSRLITSVTTTSGEATDGKQFVKLVGKDSFTPIPKIDRTYAADKAYDDGENHECLKRKKMGDALILKKTRLGKKDPNKQIWQELIATKQYQDGTKRRREIEAIFGTQKQNHGLRRARYLGLDKYHVQTTIMALVYNLKVVVAAITGSTLKGYGYKGNAVRLDISPP